jgi:hypothetical protein
MSVDTERKSGFNSRKQTSIGVSPFVGVKGNRSNIKQQEDEGIGNFVDQYSPVLIGAIVAVILVWVGNALLNYIY